MQNKRELFDNETELLSPESDEVQAKIRCLATWMDALEMEPMSIPDSSLNCVLSAKSARVYAATTESTCHRMAGGGSRKLDLPLGDEGFQAKVCGDVKHNAHYVD